ncbi:MAG: hypothetical protein JOY80_06965 [Candidatus Dormibacteraeota bacterium]|nr:hypothetical protein [Candidatus Dormibacteraeota bacterium]
MANALTEPPFAANPPVKVNVNAKTLGLVLMILGIIGLVFELIGLFAIFGFCGIYGSICGFPIIWLLGDVLGLAGLAIGTIGGYRMYQLNRQGKDWVIYGLILGLAGALVGLVGNVIAYSGLLVGVGAGAIVGFIIDLIIYFIVYYLVVISRFPGEAPLVASGAGGYGSPPPPPPA